MSSKRKSPPNKFEESNSFTDSGRGRNSSIESYRDLNNSRRESIENKSTYKMSSRNAFLGDDDYIEGATGVLQEIDAPMETSGDDVSDIGSFCSPANSDNEELEASGKFSGRYSNRRELLCRESTSGESSSNKSPTFVHPNHLDSKNKKSMDDVVRKLTSKFSSGSSNMNASQVCQVFSIENSLSNLVGDDSVESEQKLSAMISQLQKLREQIFHGKHPSQSGSGGSHHNPAKVR